jgi:hypothetical protein
MRGALTSARFAQMAASEMRSMAPKRRLTRKRRQPLPQRL